MKGLKTVQAALLALGLLTTGVGSAQINLQSGEAYFQDFNTLASTGTSNPVTSLPAGWTFVETGTGANTTYRAVDGSSNTGDTLSLGAASGPTASDRALGSLRSGSVASVFGARFRNANAGAASSVYVSYLGEQWRQGAINRCDFLRFEYSTDATSLTTGTWIRVPALDFQALDCGAAAPLNLNGNDPGNQRFILHTIDAPGIAAGSEFWIRWVDEDAAGADDALAVEDLIVVLTADAATRPLVSFDTDPVTAPEGNVGQSNPLNYRILFSQPPAPGQPVSFNVAVSGPAGRFSYSGPSSVTVTSETPLPVVLSAATIGNGDVEGDAVVTMTLSGFTGTASAQQASISKQATIIEDDLPASEIFQIQGNGVCSPFVSPCNIAQNITGSPVRSTFNIVTAVGSAGFTMQTPDALDDNDPLTSNGIYVFTAVAPRTDGGELLAVGDAVAVIGRAAEFFGLTQIAVNSTRDGANSVVRSASNQPLPSAIEFSPATNRPSKNPDALSCGVLGNFECFEAMRVSIPNGAVVAPNQRFASDPYGEVYISSYGERAVREKGARFGTSLTPANQAAGVWDGNPEVIEMDADFLLPNNVGLELNGGTRFDAMGVIGFDFGDYEFWPTELSIVPGSNHPQRAVPESLPTELTIGSFNAFRLCDAVAGNTTSLCSDSAGSETDTLRVQHQLGQVSAYIRQLLRSPDVVGMQEVENLDVLQQLATQIAADGGPAYVAYLVEGNDVGGIDVGYLVNPARVQNAAVTQLAATETWNDPGGTPTSLLHDRPPLLLAADFVGHGEVYRFHVINNHTRSRGGVDTSNAAGERIRAKRYLQGVSIATLVQGLQTAPATAGVPLFIVGDHNAYQFTDGFVDVVGLVAGSYVNDENTCNPANGVTTCKLPGGANIVNPALVNAVLLLDEDEQYSYNFTETFGAVQGSTGRDVATNQVLDHALFNAVAAPSVTGMAYARGNVDASRQRFRDCNYTNRNLTACPQGPGSWVPVGSSDHDGLVLYVSPPRQAAIFANGFEAQN